jgi:hypothetical protein
MIMLLKATHRSNAIFIKIPQHFLFRNEKSHPKIHMDGKTIFKKKKEV